MVDEGIHSSVTSLDGYRELVKFEMDAGAFGSDWGHCGLVSSHLAGLVSFKRRDPLYYANLLSSALNELLELAFRKHVAGGRIGCAILHAGGQDRIVVEIPCDDEVRDFFEDAVGLASGSDVAERYVGCLMDEGGFDLRVGLYELAVDYRARLGLERAGADAIRLVADVSLDEPETQAGAAGA